METASEAIMELVDSKHDIDLYMIKGNTDTFQLQFKIVNPNYDLHQAIGFKLFSLMGELNKDVIDSIRLEPYQEADTSMKMGMILKRFGAEFGISQKHIYSVTNISHDNGDNFCFNSQQIECPETFNVPKNCIPVKKSNSSLVISFENNNVANVFYKFSLVIEEDMPIMMKKLPGLLMKKIFIRLKLFLESLR